MRKRLWAVYYKFAPADKWRLDNVYDTKWEATEVVRRYRTWSNSAELRKYTLVD